MEFPTKKLLALAGPLKLNVGFPLKPVELNSTPPSALPSLPVPDLSLHFVTVPFDGSLPLFCGSAASNQSTIPGNVEDVKLEAPPSAIFGADDLNGCAAGKLVCTPHFHAK